MTKKIVSSVGGPENKTYFLQVNTPTLKRKDVPEPPPNFLPFEENQFKTTKPGSEKQPAKPITVRIVGPGVRLHLHHPGGGLDPDETIGGRH